MTKMQLWLRERICCCRVVLFLSVRASEHVSSALMRSTLRCRPVRLDKILYVHLPPPEGRGGHPAGPHQKNPIGGGCGCGGCGRQPSLPRLQWSRPGSSGQGSLHLRPLAFKQCSSNVQVNAIKCNNNLYRIALLKPDHLKEQRCRHTCKP
jgi:hypothetical protein